MMDSEYLIVRRRSSKMTLTEYLNQKEPQRMPNVLVELSELTIGTTLRSVNNAQTRTQVFFKTNHPLLQGAEYCLVNNGRTLMTTDSDGNPKRYSCFRLKEDLCVSK